MEMEPAAEFQNRSDSGPAPFDGENQSADLLSVRAGNLISKQVLLLSLALAAIIVAVFAPVRHFGFLGFDDLQYVSNNPKVLRGLTWDGVVWAFSTGYFANWHPLTWISHMADFEIYGTNAGWHHVTNVLFHIANTLLLFGLLHRMTGKTARSAFVAGLFAVHPMHVESVAWVSERKDVLSTCFGLLALWAYVWYVHRPRLGRYLVLLLLFVMGLMAKAMLVTLPFVLLLLDVWPLGRLPLVPDSPGLLSGSFLREQRPLLGRLLWEKVPLFVCAAASSVVTFIVQQRGGAVGSLDALPLDFRVANGVVSYVTYVAKMLWPVRLSALYPFPAALPGWEVFGSLFVLIGVSLAVLRAGSRHPYLPVGWFWYLGTLVPVIGIVQVGQQAMADRYSYVALIGLFILIAWGIPEVLANWRHRARALPAAAVITILVCAVVARGQVRYWENDGTLWSHALEVTSGNYLAHQNLGTFLASAGKLDEAVPHYVEAIRLKPDYADAYNNLGLVLMIRGKNADALRFISEAIRLAPHYAEAQNNMGLVLINLGRLDEAVVHLNQALSLLPDYPNAHYNLGKALALQGKAPEAIAHYKKALAIDPTNEDIRSALEDLQAKP